MEIEAFTFGSEGWASEHAQLHAPCFYLLLVPSVQIPDRCP